MTAARALALRPAAESDAGLLYEIYASTREEELAPLDWDASVKEAFLRQQFQAQDSYYRATFSNTTYDLIIDGDDVLGRLYVHRGEQAWLVLDIALLPIYRRRGIGTRLLERVIEEAEAAGKPVEIHVEQFNPARTLYDRLGFRQVEDQGVYLLLARPCGAVNVERNV